MATNVLKLPVKHHARLRAIAAGMKQGDAPSRRNAGSHRARHAETHLLDAQAVAQFGSWEIDLTTGTTQVSAEMRRLFGWPMKAKPDLARILDVAHPDDRSRVEEWLCHNVALRPPKAGCFFRIVRPEGTLGTMFGRSALLAARGGGTLRICGTVQDVTEQVASERAINEAAHLYRDIFENCAWGVFQTTADGRYLTANPALAHIYGYDTTSQLLSRLTDIGGQLYVDPDRRGQFIHAMKAQGQVRNFESQAYRRDGAVIWIAETCREVRTSTGLLLYYEGTVEDISERKRNEAQLLRATAATEEANRMVQAANLQLERRVEERTAELTAVQDESLRKERLSTLGKLTASVAHELRNPLSAIRNSLHVIRGAVDSAGIALERPISRVDRSIERCDHIISDLLDYAHARRLDRRATKIDRWLDECLDNYPVPAGIVIERRLGAADMLVRIDAERFARAVTNVIDNAAQALEERKDGSDRRITVATIAGETVTLVIEDNGPGIPADILPMIFDPLFSTKNFGTGLGLPTVKLVIEQHDGTVEIDSVGGRGTCVRIALPRAVR